ncbi:hypothetical protein HN858_01295 [Candidatus Falkowbacteria bacterium]|jgi:hypothetical protein|nr:hypothetical protein [Candidatus Falkowbacteria bacterium]MBT5502764.1 hypothetical protein [Candidatus Falkowbacteria bacterium]MBT6573453.1 hypothetical protein [Candidatus Falkowbacteria bacterium]MBT7348290.1 hypothetical protein [Candidatus Falkowbacteria bacterium]MBT7501162.1 hypothetical protein [Candidatus Falkowbacteria bacterium]
MKQGAVSKQPGGRTYIVSGDLRVIVSRWLGEAGPFYVPERQFFQKHQARLLSKLKEIFPEPEQRVHLSRYEYVKTGIMMLISENSKDIPVISLDQVYVEQGIADIHFDVNRVVKWSKHQAEDNWTAGWTDLGHGPRNSNLTIASQLDRIANQGRIKRMINKRVVLVDDGTWTRQSLIAAQKLLSSIGIQVEMFIVGIEIRPADESECVTLDRPYFWAEKFVKEDVIDWVSERDFYPGIGCSGRTVGESLDNRFSSEVMREYYYSIPMQGNYGAPYVLPLGDPISWANIPPEAAKDFSLFCLEQTIVLYKAIEAETQRITKVPVQVRIKDLQRPPYFYRKRPDSSVVVELKRSIELLKEKF